MHHGHARSPFDVGVGELLRRTRCRPVSGEEFEQVCRLRYDAYRREGALPDNAPLRFSDRFDLERNTTSYGFFIEERLVSSIRIHVVDRSAPEHPALHVFPDYILPLIEAGETLIDSTRFVIDHEASRRFQKIAYLMMRIPHLAGVTHDAHKLLATVRTEHQAFYRRFSGHKLVCPARPYPSLSKPLSLMTLDHHASRARLLARHPYFLSSEAECDVMFRRGVPSAGYEAMVA